MLDPSASTSSAPPQFALGEDQIAVRDMARAFAADVFAPKAVAWDEAKHFPVAEMRKAAELGMGGVYVAADVGGSALTRLDAALIFEALATGCPTVAAYMSIHNMSAWMIDAYGSDAQRKTWLPKLCTMEFLASYCLTEPSAGSDAAALTTRAVRDGNSYVLNGQKQFISGAGAGDLYVVMARTGGSGSAGISTFIVPGDTPGISLGASERKMGWNAQPTRAVVFADARIPAENRLGEEGVGFKIAMAGLDGGRLNIAACSLGGAQIALEKALAYMKERRAFGQRLDEFQALAVPPRRHGDGARGIAHVVVARGGGTRSRRRRGHHALRHGQALCHRRLLRSCQPGTATARRLRLPVGIRHREDRARSARASNSRRHKRDHASHRCAKPCRTMSAEEFQDGELIVRSDRSLRRITLNRPKALNALTLDMAVRMTALLRQWAADPEVGVVLLDGAGERAFCAGGDIRAIYDGAKAGSSLPAQFWSTEYHLDVLIARYPKPVVVAMDGLVMGGGVGLSAHAAYRVVTERSTIAMPEVGIGYFPDVGASFFLARAPWQLGTYLALTGDRIGAQDASLTGFANTTIPAERLPRLSAVLADCREGAEVQTAIISLEAPPAPGKLQKEWEWIDTCFSADDLETIIERLSANSAEGAQSALATMRKASPTSLKITLRNLREAATFRRVEESFQQDFRVSLACIAGHDFIEGIRAQIVDKDRNPVWQPKELKDVTPEIVDRHFKSLGALELTFA